MSARSKHTAWLVTIALLAVAITASGQQASTEEPEKAEDTPRRASLLRPALESAVESLKLETLAIPEPPEGTWGVIASGTGGGAIFRDADSEAEAWLGVDGVGVKGFGSMHGGYFQDGDNTGYAYVGYGDRGIYANGTFTGGIFVDSDSTGYAYVGYGNQGIYARGSLAGGNFAVRDGSGKALLGYDRPDGSTDVSGNPNDGEYGVYAYGNKAGGYFEDADGSGYAYLGYDRPVLLRDKGGELNHGEYGVYAYGNKAGGYFEDADGDSYVYVGYGDRGIEARGSEIAGYFRETDGSGYAIVAGYGEGIYARGSLVGGTFKDSNGSGLAYLGYDRPEEDSNTDADGFPNHGEYGVYAYGNKAGGYFEDPYGSGYAYLGYDRPDEDWAKDPLGDSNSGEYGVFALGEKAGGYFEEADGDGYVYLGANNSGIYARGSWQGGYFLDLNDGGSARVGHKTYKIYGNGSVNFVQNHPEDPSSVIVYAAPEGDEVATYTRGSARLEGGEARVSLGETFKWVTNPDIGLTAFLTPYGDWCDLYVAEKSTSHLLVHSADDSDCAFDYIVYGLRIGFEESTVVQEKPEEAYIPSMKDHRELLVRRPDLARYTALSRFVEQRRKLGITEELDTSRAHALVAAIHEFDPAVDAIERLEPPGDEESLDGDGSSVRGVWHEGEDPRPARSHRDPRRVPGGSDLVATVPVDDEGNVYATSFRPSSGDLASLVRVSETVEPGDVLVIDRDATGMMRRGFEGHDTGVVGVVAAKAGVVLGSESPELREEGSVETPLRAEVAMAGVVSCKVDAGYGAVWPGDLLVTSATPGHAMRADSPLPGTIVGKALEALEDGTGLIRVLVMLR